MQAARKPVQFAEKYFTLNNEFLPARIGLSPVTLLN